MEMEASRQGRFREELERLLASPEFSSSKQLQDFLRYTSERAFEGTAQLDQSEIAAAVLGRGGSFNPLEDASVRKVASLARQRLGQYYGRVGVRDGVVVSLPVRSYVPKYEEHVQQAEPALPEPLPLPEPPEPQPRPRRTWLLAALAAALVLLGSVLLWRRSGSSSTDSLGPGAFVLYTARGDISSNQADAAPQSVQLGPPLQEFDEVSTMLTFAPTQEAQQAGILIWQDLDHYVQLGRRFLGRNQLVLNLRDANGGDTSSFARYDPEGQAGNPLWLMLRRQGNSYQGFLSSDGKYWEEAGPAVSPKQPFARPRLGIYAFNGRRDAGSIPALFQHLSTGISFAAPLNGATSRSALAGLRANVPCPDDLATAVEPNALRHEYRADGGHCNSEWTVSAPAGDWDYVTKIDYFPVPGISAGIGIRGPRGAVRLVRYVSNGPCVCFIYDAKSFVAMPDLNGSPAIYLRLQNRAGILKGSYSADGLRFHDVNAQASLMELGPNPEIGLRLSINKAGQSGGSQAVRFYYLRRVIHELQPYR